VEGDRQDETIAASGNRLDEAGALHRIAQNFAHAIDRFLQRQVIIHKLVFRPDALTQFIARYDFARTFEQGLQELEGLASEFLADSGFAHFARVQVYFEDAEPHCVRRAGASANGQLRAIERSLAQVTQAGIKASRGTCAH